MDRIQLKSYIDIVSKEISDSQRAFEIVEEDIEKNKDSLSCIDLAILVLTNVLSITQEEIVSYMETVATTALQYIYGEEYSFKIDYQFKRGQPEVELYVMKNDLHYDFHHSCGVGVLNVCSFALRCICYSLLEPQPDPVLIFDEPFSAVHGKEENEKLGMMVKKISEMLQIQIIIVSGESALTEYADKIFNVQLINGISLVKEEML